MSLLNHYHQVMRKWGKGRNTRTSSYRKIFTLVQYLHQIKYWNENSYHLVMINWYKFIYPRNISYINWFGVNTKYSKFFPSLAYPFHRRNKNWKTQSRGYRKRQHRQNWLKSFSTLSLPICTLLIGVQFYHLICFFKWESQIQVFAYFTTYLHLVWIIVTCYIVPHCYF